jgi:hypothetical protein
MENKSNENLIIEAEVTGDEYFHPNCKSIVGEVSAEKYCADLLNFPNLNSTIYIENMKLAVMKKIENKS